MDDYIKVWERRESYIDFYLAHPLLLGPRQAEDSLCEGYTWGDNDFDRARPNLVRVTTNKFLSRSFENHTGLNGWKPKCFNNERELVAEFEIRSDFVNESLVSVRRRELKSFLDAKNKGLLYCFRSHRFSEKTLNELEVDPINETRSGKNYNVFVERRDIQNSNVFRRDRMRSFSLLLGKCYLFAP